MDAAALTRQFFEAVARRDLEAMRSMLADDVDYRMPNLDPMTTPDEVMATYEKVFAAIGDAQITMFDLVSDGNVVAFTVSLPGGDEPRVALIHEWNDDGKLVRYHGFANVRPPGID